MIRAQKEKSLIDRIKLCDAPLLFSALLLKGEVKVPIYSMYEYRTVDAPKKVRPITYFGSLANSN
jgi:hypothetical protein